MGRLSLWWRRAYRELQGRMYLSPPVATGTPCTKEEPADIPHYNTDPEAGRPYQTTGDATNTSPAGYAGDVHRMPDYSAVAIRGDDLSAPEKVSVTDPKIAKSHTTFYNKQ